VSQYLVLLYDDEAAYAEGGEEVASAIMKGHQVFGEKNGPKIAGGNALQPVSTATSIRRDPAGGFTVTDGPFAETKEALGGYYLIEAADLDEALAIAKEVPTVSGGVEVRPIWVFQ
jgi:hypothetical protein